MIVGALTGHMQAGSLGAVAGLAFLYLPATRLHHRIPVMMACAFAMLGSYAIGLLGNLVPAAAIPLIAAVATLTMIFCRAHSLVPPGPLFMVMAASIAAFSPVAPTEVVATLGYFSFGCVWACALAVLYSTYILRYRSPQPAVVPSKIDLQNALLDSVVTGVFVAGSLTVAALLALEKAYWVPVSCLAVMQGVSLRASWSRSLHRILGTAAGLGVTAIILPYLRQDWAIAAAVILLTFVIETIVVRHYGFAAVFITPLTILLAEANGLGMAGDATLMEARLIDTIVGALIGTTGALCLHSPTVREILLRPLAAIRRKKNARV